VTHVSLYGILIAKFSRGREKVERIISSLIHELGCLGTLMIEAGNEVQCSI
jgi:hypothetical protein